MSRGMWDLKKLMFAVQGGLCFYCWKPMSQEREHAQAAHYATKDHLVPVSGGGAADWTNTILACTTCNRAKGSRMPTERERARHGHLHALFNERVELRRAEIAAKQGASEEVREAGSASGGNHPGADPAAPEQLLAAPPDGSEAAAGPTVFFAEPQDSSAGQGHTLAPAPPLIEDEHAT